MLVVPDEKNEGEFVGTLTRGLEETKDNLATQLESRAAQRVEEIRDLHVLEAYAILEEDLRNLLHAADSGIMSLSDRDAQGCTRKVAEFFDTEGENIRKNLPDEECMARFSDVMASRRLVAMQTAARHESQEFFKWKERAATRTIDEVIKSAAADPDLQLLEHGAEVIEGTIKRLYGGDDEKVLSLRYLAAVQEMYRGAIEAIGVENPLRALSLLELWKEHFDAESYAELKDKLTPGALRQKVRDEYEDLRFMPPEAAQKIIDKLKDEELHSELTAMVRTGIELRESGEEQVETQQLDSVCESLFAKLEKGELTPDIVLYSNLPQPERLLWLSALEYSVLPSSDAALIKTVEAILTGSINNLYEIYLACARGLSVDHARICAYLFGLRKRPDWQPLLNCLSALQKNCESYGATEKLYCAACFDFLSRYKKLDQENKPFEFSKLVSEVVTDHFLLIPQEENNQGDQEKTAAIKAARTSKNRGKKQIVEGGSITDEQSLPGKNDIDERNLIAEDKATGD